MNRMVITAVAVLSILATGHHRHSTATTKNGNAILLGMDGEPMPPFPQTPSKPGALSGAANEGISLRADGEPMPPFPPQGPNYQLLIG